MPINRPLSEQYEDESLNQLLRTDSSRELTDGDGLDVDRLEIQVPIADHAGTADVATRAFTADRTTQTDFPGTHSGDGSGLLNVPLSTPNQNLLNSYDTRITAAEDTITTPSLPSSADGLSAGQLYTQTGTELGLSGAAATLNFVLQV